MPAHAPAHALDLYTSADLLGRLAATSLPPDSALAALASRGRRLAALAPLSPEAEACALDIDEALWALAQAEIEDERQASAHALAA